MSLFMVPHLYIDTFSLYLGFFTLNTCKSRAKIWMSSSEAFNLTLGVDISTNFSFSFLLAVFWPIGRRNKVRDGRLYSQLIAIDGLEGDEYAP